MNRQIDRDEMPGVLYDPERDAKKVPGSSGTLTEEQRQWFRDNRGVEMAVVASHPHGISSRRQRRAFVKASKLRNDGRAKEGPTLGA